MISPEAKAKKAAYKKDYRQRPEVKEQERIYSQRSEVKERKRIYSQRSEVKEKSRAYHQRPEAKEKRRVSRKAHLQLPGIKEKHNARQRVYRQQPEVRKRNNAKQKIYNQRPEVKEQGRIRGQRPEVRKRERQNWLQKKYGLTPDVFESMISGQNSVCAACGSSDWGSKGPVVDHNHITGIVRGILCGACNRAIGLFKDSPQIIRAVADYLEKNS